MKRYPAYFEHAQRIWDDSEQELGEEIPLSSSTDSCYGSSPLRNGQHTPLDDNRFMSSWSDEAGVAQLLETSSLHELDLSYWEEELAWVNSEGPSNKSREMFQNHPGEDSPPAKKKLFE